MFRRQVLGPVFPVVCAASGCGGSAAARTAPAGSRSSTASEAAERCANVDLEGTRLGIFDGSLGAVPTPVTIVGIEGMLVLVITSMSPSGAPAKALSTSPSDMISCRRRGRFAPTIAPSARRRAAIRMCAGSTM